MYVDGRSPRLKRGRSCEGYAAQLHKGQRSFQLNQTSKQRVNLLPLNLLREKPKHFAHYIESLVAKCFATFKFIFKHLFD